MVSRQHTTGGKPRLGKTSKMAQRDLRRLLITGTMAVVRSAWCDDRSLARQDAGAQAEGTDRSGLANRMARIVWALTTKSEIYRVPAAA
ncbi:MAG: transposase [Deltaproteobacteria bacterium]|nr:transposase [Deltaproteobacteria bacterium]